MRKKWKKQRWKISEYFCRDQGEKDNGRRKAENAKQTKHFQMVAKKRENEGEPGDETLCRQRKYTPKSG